MSNNIAPIRVFTKETTPMSWKVKYEELDEIRDKLSGDDYLELGTIEEIILAMVDLGYLPPLTNPKT
jgi:hypothetical protein